MRLVEDHFGKAGFAELVMVEMRRLGLETYSTTLNPPPDRGGSLGGLLAAARGIVANRTGRLRAQTQAPNDAYLGGSYAGSKGANGGSCTVIHAILRSRRGDGKEALVLVTPLQLTSGAQSAPHSHPCILGCLLMLTQRSPPQVLLALC